VQNSLKTEQAKEFVRQSPDLKEVFPTQAPQRKRWRKSKSSPLDGGKRIRRNQVATGSFSRQVMPIRSGFDPDVLPLRRV
jgi:hypothetical protein